MKAIAAISSSWGIGRDNDLLFHIPEDLAFFHRMTAGQTMILGRRNLESFPGGRPLPNRRHLVLTRQEDYEAAGVEVFHTLPQLAPILRNCDPEKVWVCGGGEIYREFLPYCTQAILTHIDADPEPGPTVFFPDLSQEKNWELTEQGELREYRGISFRFCTWTNRSPLPFPEA